MFRRLPSDRRIFLGTQEISGLYRNLERGLIEAGREARLITTHPHPFDYGQATENPWPARVASRAVLMHRETHGVRRIWWAARFLLASIALLLWCIPRFDVYVFGWGISILPSNVDLLILRALGKRVVTVIGHGSEARPPYMSAVEDNEPIEGSAVEALMISTAGLAARVRRLERWSSVVVGLPTTGHFLNRPFVDFYALGLATDTAQIPESVSDIDGSSSKVVLLHVPSNPAVKGTDVIRAAMRDIASRHPDVEYREVIGVSNDEVLRQLATCSLVIDQVWSDIPMAAIGVEAASLGKPTLIAGYAWHVWRERLGPEAMPPAILASPDDLVCEIEHAILDRNALSALGDEARRFVDETWNRRAVAMRYTKVIDGVVPSAWWVNPSTITYAWGCGSARSVTVERVKALVSRFGLSSLQWPNARRAYAEVLAAAEIGQLKADPLEEA